MAKQLAVLSTEWYALLERVAVLTAERDVVTRGRDDAAAAVSGFCESASSTPGHTDAPSRLPSGAPSHRARTSTVAEAVQVSRVLGRVHTGGGAESSPLNIALNVSPFTRQFACRTPTFSALAPLRRFAEMCVYIICWCRRRSPP